MSSVYARIVLEFFILISLISVFIYKKRTKRRVANSTTPNVRPNHPVVRDKTIEDSEGNDDNSIADITITKKAALITNNTQPAQEHNQVVVNNESKDSTQISKKPGRLKHMTIYPSDEISNNGLIRNQNSVNTIYDTKQKVLNRSITNIKVSSPSKENKESANDFSLQQSDVKSRRNIYELYDSNITNNRLKDENVQDGESIKLITFFDISYLLKETEQCSYLADGKDTTIYAGYTIENSRFYVDLFYSQKTNCFIFQGDPNKYEYIIYNYIALLRKRIMSTTEQNLLSIFMINDAVKNQRFKAILDDKKLTKRMTEKDGINRYYIVISSYKDHEKLRTHCEKYFTQYSIPLKRLCIFCTSKEDVSSEHPVIIAM
jgi:hypothetical protein